MPLWSWVRLYLSTRSLHVALGPFRLPRDFGEDILKRKYFLHSCVFQITSAPAHIRQGILGSVVFAITNDKDRFDNTKRKQITTYLHY